MNFFMTPLCGSDEVILLPVLRQARISVVELTKTVVHGTLKHKHNQEAGRQHNVKPMMR